VSSRGEVEDRGDDVAASTGSGPEVPGGHPRRNASEQSPVAPGPSGSKKDGRASGPDQAAAKKPRVVMTRIGVSPELVERSAATSRKWTRCLICGRLRRCFDCGGDWLCRRCS
jgi:hypothetical protein